MNAFVEYLHQELDQRGWSISELARRSQLATSTISDVLNEHTQPGQKFLTNVAFGLRVPPLRIFRLAGVLPRIIGSQADWDDELLAYVHELTPANQDAVLVLARGLYRHQVADREDPPPIPNLDNPPKPS
jgi:transcriptional regulator with XRE-family HTH domain